MASLQMNKQEFNTDKKKLENKQFLGENIFKRHSWQSLFIQSIQRTLKTQQLENEQPNLITGQRP